MEDHKEETGIERRHGRPQNTVWWPALFGAFATPIQLKQDECNNATRLTYWGETVHEDGILQHYIRAWQRLTRATGNPPAVEAIVNATLHVHARADWTVWSDDLEVDHVPEGLGL